MMVNISSFIDSLKQLIGKITHRECDVSEATCQRLKHLNEHYSKVAPKQVAVSGSLSDEHANRTNKKLVAYSRHGGESNSVDIQRERIDSYCLTHGFSVVAHHTCQSEDDNLALQDAITDLEHCAGLIVSDISRLVKHHTDPLRDLAPLLHDSFFNNSKILISVKEGINTSTSAGQQALIEFMKELRDIEQGTC